MNKKFLMYTVMLILGAAIGSAGYYLLSSGTTSASISKSASNGSKGKKVLFWR